MKKKKKENSMHSTHNKFIKFISLIAVLSLVFALSSCSGNNESKISTTKVSTAPPTTLSPYVMNPLTGVTDLKREMENKRPVAVMVNNIKIAQDVQTGLN